VPPLLVVGTRASHQLFGLQLLDSKVLELFFNRQWLILGLSDFLRFIFLLLCLNSNTRLALLNYKLFESESQVECSFDMVIDAKIVNHCEQHKIVYKLF
jgi:hypothetical protein